MDITITLTVNDSGLLVAASSMNSQVIGTIGDNNSQTLIFDRSALDSTLQAGDLQLSFLPTSAAWQVINIGTESSYTIPNSLTGAGNLMLSIALIVGDTTITGANRISFAFRAGGSSAGTTPSTIDSAWITVRDNAMLTTVYDTDKNGVIDAAALPLSSALDSDSAVMAATSAAVKAAYNLAATTDENLINNYGGSNLLRGTKDLLGANSQAYVTSDTYRDFTIARCDNSAATTTTYGNLLTWSNAINVESDAWYTLSFWAKGTGIFTSYFYLASGSLVAEGVNSSGNTTSNADGSIITTVTSDWQRYWVRWKTTTTASGTPTVLPARVYGGNDIYMCGVRLDRGKFAYDWDYGVGDITAMLSDITNIKTAITALGGTI